jgi:outer membrane protein TolC
MRIAFVAPLFLVAACTTVGPEYERPETSVNPAWLDAELAQFETTPAELGEWWRILEDPVLNEFIDTALINNNGIRISGAIPGLVSFLSSWDALSSWA